MKGNVRKNLYVPVPKLIVLCVEEMEAPTPTSAVLGVKISGKLKMNLKRSFTPLKNISLFIPFPSSYFFKL